MKTGADMKTEEHDGEAPDLAALRTLPARDADPAAAASIRAAALAAFTAAHGGPRARAAHGAVRLWSRFGVPAVLAVVVCLYLQWAVAATASLYP
jgi:hypothetical protein